MPQNEDSADGKSSILWPYIFFNSMDILNVGFVDRLDVNCDRENSG